MKDTGTYPRPRKLRASFRPMVELLEERWAPAADLDAGLDAPYLLGDFLTDLQTTPLRLLRAEEASSLPATGNTGAIQGGRDSQVQAPSNGAVPPNQDNQRPTTAAPELFRPTQRAQVPATGDEDGPAPAASPSSPGLAAATPAAARDTRATLYFEPNRGQARSDAAFIARANGYTVLLNPIGATLINRADTPDIVDLKLLHTNRMAVAVVQQPLPGISNYLNGNDPSQWLTAVPHFGQVVYHGVYPGIDVAYHGSASKHLEYDFIVAPGANPSAIRLSFSGTRDVRIDGDGNLVLAKGTEADKELVQAAPVCFQDVNGQRQSVAGRFVLAGREIGFEVRDYDPTRPLVIDPTVDWSTYLGTAGDDEGRGIAVDDAGNSYVVGNTLLGGGPIIPGGNDAEIFVAKLSPDGQDLIYLTYIGGDNDDSGNGITVDDEGRAWITGGTFSHDYPTTLDAEYPSPLYIEEQGPVDWQNAFLTRFDALGVMEYSSYFGRYHVGTDTTWPNYTIQYLETHEAANGIAIDELGNVHIAGGTSGVQTSSGVGTPPPDDYTHIGDPFAASFLPTGHSFATFWEMGGEEAEDCAQGIAVTAAGDRAIAGWTESTDFPHSLTTIQPGYGGGDTDAFLMFINSAGSITGSGLLGGSGDEEAYAVALDPDGNAYVTGRTQSTDFPTSEDAFMTSLGGTANADDAFITKVTAGGALGYSTYLGGGNGDFGFGVAVGDEGIAYVTGMTLGEDFPIVAGFQEDFGGVSDAFMVRLASDGSHLITSTYLGGMNEDAGLAITIDDEGLPYLTGFTESQDFPVFNALQGANAGGRDAFVVKNPPPPLFLTEVYYVTDHPPITSDDSNTTYGGPHWKDINLDGATFGAGERRYPSSFTRAATLKLSAVFSIKTNLLPVGVPIHIKGDGPGDIDIPMTAANVQPAVGQASIFNVLATAAFPNVVKPYEPFVIKWQYSIDNGQTWKACGESSNRLYVTYAKALLSNDAGHNLLWHTPIHISTRAADGLDTVPAVLGAIWNEFASRDIGRMDGATLTYYDKWTIGAGNDQTWELLNKKDGNCVAWAAFFIDTLKSQGIDFPNEVRTVLGDVTTVGATSFIVKEWTFHGAGTSGDPAFPYVNTYFGNDPFRDNYYDWFDAEVTEDPGISGQGQPNPASMFINHVLVKINDVYYDPSYGLTHASLLAFENAAVAGFYKVIPNTKKIFFRTNPAGLDMVEIASDY